MRCDECGGMLYQAGEIVLAGTYLRLDDGSRRRIVLDHSGPLPATFDGHIAEYRDAVTPCGCTQRQLTSASAPQATLAPLVAERRSPNQQ